MNSPARAAGARLRAYLVDDEQPALDRLTDLLDDTGRVAIVGRSTNPQEALDALDALAPPGSIEIDVLFLDIQMPGLTGFDLLARWNRPVPVVFTTAYDQYTIDAFAVNSIDYLLKPIEAERLNRALDKLERLAVQPQTDVRAVARELAAHLAGGRGLERLASRIGERTLLLEVRRITHFIARDKLTYAALDGREHAVDYSLSELEQRLEPRRFVRVHRNAIVNITYVHELSPGVDAGMIVRLKDPARTEFSVARDRLRDLKDRLGV